MSGIRYGKTIATCLALSVVALFLTLLLTHTGRAKPHPAPPRPQGTVLPNDAGREAIKPGNYATAINIHNPSLGTTLTLYKRAVLAPYESYDGKFPPSSAVTYQLGPGYAVEVDCTDIQKELLQVGTGSSVGFIKGFVSIFVRAPEVLNVVGVYTAEPPQVTGTTNYPSLIPGIALEMLNITPQIVTSPGAATTVAARGLFNEYSAKFLCGEVPLPPT